MSPSVGISNVGAGGRLQAPIFAFRSKADGGRPWRVRRLDLEEELSGRFVATVELDHENEEADAGTLLSASAVLEMARPGSPGRRFCGVVRAVEQAQEVTRGLRPWCRVRVEPAFFCLDEEVLTRPFVGLTAPEILREVLAPALGSFDGRELELRLERPSDDAGAARGYGVRALCVQYGESTHDFCRRLMALEGMSYFFDHTGDVEKLVVVDEAQFESAGPPLPVLLASGLTADRESVERLGRVRSRTAAGIRLKPFDHLEPNADWPDAARAVASAPVLGALEEGGVYDARPGITFHGYSQGQHLRSDVLVQTRLRAEQEAVGADVVRGASNAVGLQAGHFLVLEAESGAPAWTAGAFLITSVSHAAEVPEAQATNQTVEPRHESTFALLPRAVPFRPAPLPRPRALEDWGLVLSTFEGDPIDTDRHGRVRVHFAYDARPDLTADRRSPWIPVATPWAGAGYGLQIIPRAGMLARLEYIFGDPDRPVVVECFPTGANRVPAALPAQKSRLTLRSKSLRDGARDNHHFNEVALDDAAEREQVFLRAGHDLRRKVLHDDRTETVHDEVHVVGGDQALIVHHDRRKTVHTGETETVRKDRQITVEADDDRVVAQWEEGGGQDVDLVDGEQTLHARSTRTTSVTATERGVFKGGRVEEVGPTDSAHIHQLRRMRADVEWKAAQGQTSLVLAESKATGLADGELELRASTKGKLHLFPKGPAHLIADKLEIKVGSSRLIMDGDRILLKATEVVASGAGATVKLDPLGATTTAKEIVSSAVVLNELKGPMVFISGTPGAARPAPAHQHQMRNVALQAEQLQLAKPDEDPLNLECTLLGHDLAPAANVTYQLLLPTGELFTGQTDGSGKLREKLPGATRTAEISYEPAPGAGPICRSLSLVDDDSPDAPVEIMRQLGFGTPTAAPEEVVRSFQGMMRLPETGTVDGPTKEALDGMRAGKGPRKGG